MQKTLIDLFASKRCEEIDGDDLTRAFRMPDLAEVQAQRDYNETFALVRKVKRKIELIENGYPDKTDQALQCLAELKDRRAESRYITDEFTVTRDLIDQTLYQTWPDLQAEFKKRLMVIEAWNDVFVSYTNRDAISTNQSYEALILKEWGAEIDPTVVENNYVARTLAKFLEQNNLRSYIDYKRIECGDDIEDQILEHSANSVALIQLLEPIIYQEPEHPKRNWCLEEYNEFAQSDDSIANFARENNTRFFALARAGRVDDIEPADKPDRYQPWIDQAKRELHLKLNDYQPPFDDLRLDVKNVARQIVAARNKLFDAMLGSWT